jgi:hypothetical protein
MAQISQKPLLDQPSNKFLKDLGFQNISNSFDNSAWKHVSLKVILGLPFDAIVDSHFKLWNLLYSVGYQNGYGKAIVERDYKID